MVTGSKQAILYSASSGGVVTGSSRRTGLSLSLSLLWPACTLFAHLPHTSTHCCCCCCATLLSTLIWARDANSCRPCWCCICCNWLEHCSHAPRRLQHTHLSHTQHALSDSTSATKPPHGPSGPPQYGSRPLPAADCLREPAVSADCVRVECGLRESWVRIA